MRTEGSPCGNPSALLSECCLTGYHARSWPVKSLMLRARLHALHFGNACFKFCKHFLFLFKLLTIFLNNLFGRFVKETLFIQFAFGAGNFALPMLPVLCKAVEFLCNINKLIHRHKCLTER